MINVLYTSYNFKLLSVENQNLAIEQTVTYTFKQTDIFTFKT